MNKKIIRFIDCGANVGQSAEWANEVLSGLDCSLKVDSFEANPELVEAIKIKNIPNTTVHHNAVSTENAHKKFYLQNWGAKTGSSLSKFKESVIKTVGFFGRMAVRAPNEEAAVTHTNEDGWTASTELRPGEPTYYDIGYIPNNSGIVELTEEQKNEGIDVFIPMAAKTFLTLCENGTLLREDLLYDSVDVECIDVVSWMEENIDFEKEFVILKLDIEGTEYEVVSKLLSTGFYKKIDALLVEWTSLAKLAYTQEFKGKEESVELCIRKAHEEFKFSWDWQHPEQCREPLLEYIERVKNDLE